MSLDEGDTLKVDLEKVKVKNGIAPSAKQRYNLVERSQFKIITGVKQWTWQQMTIGAKT